MEIQKQKNIEIEKLKATRTVYCYYFPEIRKVIDEVVKNYPHKVFLSSITPGLDDFHFPVIGKFIRYNEKQLPSLKDFKYRYFTAGASEGIFHLLVKLKTKNPEAPIYTLKGEYEGYKEYAKEMGIKIIEVNENEEFSKLNPGIFFISNPSSRNGNIIKNEFINEICKYHKVVYDTSYAGLTRDNKFDLSNQNIIAVVTSMSKPFGLYYYRIGFTFSREPIETLEANIWFKNIFSLVVADRILDEIRPQQLYNKYKPLQDKIIKELNKKHNLNLKASDVILLANTDKHIEQFMRDKFCRLCLTPYFLEEEKI
ncbi:MAG: aminotransferase class I/II-fold pyridoxal phosphate-dependent enzyme [Candidatus Nanoarchaeia archaeon]|nr:aminotransferase class I/II-fold pyridoxal phosphate-dependent enzyme [Candidatus Nanoarchaeia archaeon]MDD5740475.1 aminotransferase class I/II-fold pyridoxal phosphate-dependent enzyme [Candidatus Nanoarchaeia archaeon]